MFRENCLLELEMFDDDDVFECSWLEFGVIKKWQPCITYCSQWSIVCSLYIIYIYKCLSEICNWWLPVSKLLYYCTFEVWEIFFFGALQILTKWVVIVVESDGTVREWELFFYVGTCSCWISDICDTTWRWDVNNMDFVIGVLFFMMWRTVLVAGILLYWLLCLFYGMWCH